MPTERHGAVHAAVFACLLVLIGCAHLVRLDGVPRGLFVDESSIGYNAATIAESGEDEDGVRFPVFFRAFGEYKNPLFIYAAALVFRLGGVSVTLLRLTSCLWFAVLLGGVACLARRLFPDSPATVLYAVAAAGFLPWFFTVSRIAFEVISQPAVTVWMLWLAFAVYESERPRLWLAGGLGLLTGLSTYSYSTARLLTPAFAVALLAAYAGRRFWSRHAAVLAGGAAALVPYVIFSLRNPGALTRRFEHLTWLYDDALSPAGKLAAFCGHYAIYWAPRYLLVDGDLNRRNSTGHAGEVYVVVFVLAVAGAVGLVRRGAGGRGRFVLLLALNLAAAPVAAAFTSGTSALRSILLGLYLLVFSCFGFALLAGWRSPRWRAAALAAVALALAVEAGRYVADYFGPYVEESVAAFGSWDFRGALLTALAQRPRRIVVSQKGNQPYAHLEFYRRTLGGPPAVPIEMADEKWPRAASGVCVLFFNPEAYMFDAERFTSRTWGLDRPTILRCFGPEIPGAPAATGAGGE